MALSTSMKNLPPDTTYSLQSPLTADSRRRRRSWTEGRFRAETISQLDPFHGAPECQVPQDHKARSIKRFTDSFDMGAAGKPRSGLGRPGNDPRGLLAVLLYASLIGIHAMTRVAALLVTDSAFRLLSGGHTVSASTLCSFRRRNGELFERALGRTISDGLAEGLVDTQHLATDGMRLRAHASTKAIRTRERSKKRLATLAGIDVSKLNPKELRRHEAKVAKHEEAIARCDAEEVTSVCVTNPECSLMKFPSGASAPGHRIVATVAGQRARLVVGLVINKAPTDYGQLRGAMADTRKRLTKAGLSEEKPLRVAADAGFLGDDDQVFIAEARGTVDVVVPPPTEGTRKNGDVEMFKRADFKRADDGAVVCPAGTPMKPPKDRDQPVQTWTGQGCPDCPLKPKCTTAKERRFEVDTTKEQLHAAIRKRFEEPGAEDFYKTRMSTVEPVFSVIESDMLFTRASSRHKDTIVAEILLKFAAYNVNRLMELREAKARAAKPAVPTRRDYRRRASLATRARRRPAPESGKATSESPTAVASP